MLRRNSVSIESNSPPRLALVLGSGGVRSIAAVGIAEVLAAEGLRPDLIVGCSSGALFGATIAMGMTSREALQAATSLWSAELTQQHRWPAYAQLVAPKLFGFDAGFALRDDRRIAQRIRRAFGDWRLEDLPTPLRIVATDARSGKRVVLRHGALTQAVRASVAVPLVFPSVEIDGRRLVDGVVSDPLPISVASDATVVVALGFKGVMPRRIDRASRLVAQASTALINNLQQARVDAARNAGQQVVEIELALDRHVGLWETRAMPYLFEAGCRAARVQLAQIMALARQSPPCSPGYEALAA
jgi:NTE family protein